MTKEMLSEGISKYIQAELIPNVPDASIKMILGTVANAIRKNSHLIDTILESPMIHAIVASENGYNLNEVMDAVQEAMNQYGNLKLTIPKIPLLIPNEQIMSFSASDIEKLRGYLSM